MLCSPCARVRCESLERAVTESGEWHRLVNEKHADQLIGLLSQRPMMCVDSETKSVCHVFRLALAEAAKSHTTSTKSWERTKIEFAEKHASKHALWHHPRDRLLRRNTPLRLYDSKSILAKLRRSPQTGLSITSVVKEYDQAYVDVQDLIDKGLVLQHNHTIWLRPPNSSPS